MKQIIIKHKPNPIQTISVNGLTEDSVILGLRTKADDSPEVFVLEHEKGTEAYYTGYILRYWDSKCGHSGHSPTRQVALTKAYGVTPDLEFFEFLNLKEACQFLVDRDLIKKT